MGDVINLFTRMKQRVQPEERRELIASDILRAIADEEPDKVFLVVWPKDGSLPTYHSNTKDIETILLRLNQFIHKYYNGDFFDADPN